MANNDVQETLDRILADLKSNDPTRCLNAIQELGTLNFSSRAVVAHLEQLALKGESDVRRAALQALSSRTSRYIASQRSTQKPIYRGLILKEIDDWRSEGLLEPGQAEVLKRRYDFDLQTADRMDSAPGVAVIGAQPTGWEPKIVKVAAGQQGEGQIAPAGPRLSLTQTLLSEASIKIYLYLGAFFVIASALILAALVEAARLPILAVATLAFGGASFVLRKRLPQPSFALFIVFSFLLPIDANVLEETMGLSEPALSVYWTFLFLIMSVIWGFSVWLYESRFFSAIAFISLSLAFYRAGQIFDTEIEIQIFLGVLASLVGLAGTVALSKWKDRKFSLSVFLLAQLQVFGLLFTSLLLVSIHIFESGIADGWWLLIAVTWLIAAFFFALSDLLIPTFAFPWLAAAALLPLPWFFLNTLHAIQPVYALGCWLWGAVFALVSEATTRLSSERIKKYHWPLLAGSVPLFMAAVAVAIMRDRPALTLTIYTLTALVYAALHILRPRWYVWSAALISALFAFFTCFQLPILQRLDVPLVYQSLIASCVLVIPELFTRSPLSLRSEWRTPAIGFGILVSLLTLPLALADLEHTGRGALVLVVYALLLTLHALHSKYAWLGYIATACGSLSVVYALHHFNLDLWLPALTVLSALYYATGFFFRRMESKKAWGNVLVDSGLALGILLSLTSLVVPRETSGWYIIVIALLFAVEVFARPFAWLELVVQTLLSISLYQILDDFNGTGRTRIEHFLFGVSLIWWGGELLFSRLVTPKRTHQLIQLGVGSLVTLLATFSLLGTPEPRTAAIYFFMYAVFFLLYAYLKGEPRVAYLAAAFLPLTIIKVSELIQFKEWMYPLIALAVLYYAAGALLQRSQGAIRRSQRAQGWDEMLLYSGLGLGVFTSVAAPFQGGLGSSIPVAIAATLFAAEAFARRNVWWALPANMLYLMSYFMILIELDVDEPQFYSVGAALLGMLMHYLLTRAGSKTGAFVAGMLSQLVLLGTTYIQMVSTERLSFFIVLFIQSMLVLLYGLIHRSRSLVMTPIVFAVVGVMTVVYSALKGLGPVILIGSTGLVLLMAGIVAVLMRERITRLGEQLSDWKP